MRPRKNILCIRRSCVSTDILAFILETRNGVSVTTVPSLIKAYEALEAGTEFSVVISYLELTRQQAMGLRWLTTCCSPKGQVLAIGATRYYGSADRYLPAEASTLEIVETVRVLAAAKHGPLTKEVRAMVEEYKAVTA